MCHQAATVLWYRGCRFKSHLQKPIFEPHSIECAKRRGNFKGTQDGDAFTLSCVMYRIRFGTEFAFVRSLFFPSVVISSMTCTHVRGSDFADVSAILEIFCSTNWMFFAVFQFRAVHDNPKSFFLLTALLTCYLVEIVRRHTQAMIMTTSFARLSKAACQPPVLGICATGWCREYQLARGNRRLLEGRQDCATLLGNEVDLAFWVTWNPFTSHVIALSGS